MSLSLNAGAAVADITPARPAFLFGYPHVARYSTGIHDRLLSSALYLSDGRTPLLFVANDVIYVGKASAERVRRRITERTGVPAGNIMVTATHTHSGPVTVDCVFCEADAVVPKADPAYVALLEDGIVDAAVRAVGAAQPAEVGLAIADANGIGTHRRDPAGPSNLAVPVLSVRSVGARQPIAAMLVCSMHPTVLHEDSTLVSGDFPAAARRYVQQNVLGTDCPVLHHTGPCGNQSPRHVVRGQTFAEAERLGEILGRAVERAIRDTDYRGEAALATRRALVDLPVRAFPPIRQAEQVRAAAAAKLARLREQKAPSPQVRTAEVDWFGSEELVT
ncbi:MAG: neutral/alkaline non-lysosomal ceramidase N-terminal domain-containing protein, partial [Phycisphaerae bacterium]|nr:neutral/alkaline non-lysosomal ceramidase N-terminal domain-containing protein [Phycisphaerae bacterium]